MTSSVNRPVYRVYDRAMNCPAYRVYDRVVNRPDRRVYDQKCESFGLLDV